MNNTKIAETYDLFGKAGDRPEYEGKPARSIVQCTLYRSGSSLLSEALCELGGYGVPLDYFDRGLRPYLESRWQTADLDDFICALYRHRTEQNGTFSTKMDWGSLLSLAIETGRLAPDAGQINIEDLSPAEAAGIYGPVRETIESLFPRAKFIFNQRCDRARQAVSWVRARQSGHFWELPGAHHDPMREPQYDYEQILKAASAFTNEERRFNDFFSYCGIQPIRVVYEDFIARYEETIRRVAAELDGREIGDIRPARLKRQGNAISEQWILRFLREHAEKSAQKQV